MYPIDIERPLNLDLSSADTAAAVFSDLKAALPYVFRFERAAPHSRHPHPDLENTTLSVSSIEPKTAKRIIEEVVAQLPTGWQATRLPSHIILYKERRSYPQGTLIRRST